MKDIKNLKVGDRVLFNPSFCYASGVRKITEINGSICSLEDGYTVELKNLLPVPLFEVGDSVILKSREELEALRKAKMPFGLVEEMLDFAGKTLKINKSLVDHYPIVRSGQDTAEYFLEDGLWSWSSDCFYINKSINLNKKKNENRLQEEGDAFLRGLQSEKSGIYGRRIKATIMVGSLSYQTVSGK